MLTRLGKRKLITLFGVLAFAVLVGIVLYFCLKPKDQPSDGASLLASVPFIVGKNSLSTRLADVFKDQINERLFNFAEFSASSINAQFFSVGATNCTDQNAEAIVQTLEQIDVMLRLFDKENKYVIPAVGSSDIYAARRVDKMAGFLSVDGGYAVDSKTSVLRDYYRMGVRSLAIGTPCNGAESNGGNEQRIGQESLTDDEKTIIIEMNRLGVLTDLTGSSSTFQSETIHYSKAPVVFSSSSSNAITPHPENVDDSVLDALKTNDGIVMVSLRADQTCSDISDCSIDNVIEHINYIASIVGKNKVGIGGDLDRFNATYPQGLSSTSGYVTLFDKLIANQTWTVSELQGLAGNNFMRIMTKIEDVARSMAAEPYSPAEIEE